MSRGRRSPARRRLIGIAGLGKPVNVLVFN